jgi:hypothetical protein
MDDDGSGQRSSEPNKRGCSVRVTHVGDCAPARPGNLDSPEGVATQCSQPERRPHHRPATAQWHAKQAAGRPKQAKLGGNAASRTYVEGRLVGGVMAPSDACVSGPPVPPIPHSESCVQAGAPRPPIPPWAVRGLASWRMRQTMPGSATVVSPTGAGEGSAQDTRVASNRRVARILIWPLH